MVFVKSTSDAYDEKMKNMIVLFLLGPALAQASHIHDGCELHLSAWLSVCKFITQ